MKTDHKDIALRAVKTFVQAFVPVLISAFAAADGTRFAELKALGSAALVSATAAGLSAAWNYLSALLGEVKNDGTAQ